MKCPNCDVNLLMSERSGVEIDYCPKCRGVWLDRGELDKLIEKTEKTDFAGSKARSEQNRHDHEDHYYRKKKKHSILGEIFDF